MTLKFAHCFNVTQAFPLSYLTAKGTKTQKTETQSPWRPLKGRGRLKAWTQTSLITYTCSQLSVPQRRDSDMENNIYQSNRKLQLAFECAYGKPREMRFGFNFGNHYREWLCAGDETELPGGNRKITEGTTRVECLSNLRSISCTFSRDNCSTLQLWSQKFKISFNYHSVCLDRWGLVHSKSLRGQSVSLPWDAILPTPKVDRVRLTSSSQHRPVLPAKSGSDIWPFPELVKPLAWVHVPKTAPMHPLRRNLQTNHCLCYFSLPFRQNTWGKQLNRKRICLTHSPSW